MLVRCSRCGRNLGAIVVWPAHCPCGNALHRSGERYRTAPSNATICRQNLCGHYVVDDDTCQLTIDIGLAKGKKRKGKVGWLDSHPQEPCPDSPPRWGPAPPPEPPDADE